MKILFAVAAVVLGLAYGQTTQAATVTVETTNVTFTPFSSIGSIASADLGTDGTPEIIVGAGASLPPTVAVYRQDGSKVGEFLAYAEGFRGGVNVASCDVNGDGLNDIVTGARFGGGPHVRIFDHMGTPMAGGFFAYAADFRGGVHVSCDDVDGDGRGDIVTGAGLSGGPHIKVFDYDGTLLYEVFDGSAAENTGSYVKADASVIYAARIGVGDASTHGYRVSNGALVAIGSSTYERDAFFSSADGVRAEIASELYSNTAAKHIVVDISEQKLTAYEYGIAVNAFLVSTGTYSYPTPLGTTAITAKLPVHVYSGEDYYYPNVKWNLRFRPHYYIHTAYWHNNFGHRMSHGCVNTRLEDAAWIYEWSNVGTPVEIIS